MKALLILFIGFFFVGCTQSSTQVQDDTNLELTSPFDVNLYALNSLVCDPVGENPPPEQFDSGLKAELYYLRSDQPRTQAVSHYIENGVKSTQNLFFSTINVPTRLFSDGFPTETGGLIETDEGDVLHEYFALRMFSTLKLGPDDLEGEYEFALLADDGAIMTVRDSNGNYVEVVNNDGDHPTKFGCGNTLTLTKDTEYVIRYDYYQGPRFNIAMIPMWRKVEGSRQHEPLCGVIGATNDHWFDYENGSTPRQPYKDLLARGWKPIGAQNYHLPQTVAAFNPCVETRAPKISNFNVEDFYDGVVRVSWSTDLPATSQVLYKNMETGEEVLTTSDNRLRTNHIVMVSPLKVGQSYQFRAVSITGEYGKTVSPALTLTPQ